MRIPKIVSGGQTGVDQAALRAARAMGLETGGWAPKGWLTEDGPAPWLADYGLQECAAPGYAARTDANARDSDLTIWIGSTESTGFRTTVRACFRLERPLFLLAEGMTVHDVFGWLKFMFSTKVVNVAGDRESVSPGVGEDAEKLLLELFRMVKAGE